MRLGRHGRGRPAGPAPAGQGPPAVTRLRLPQGHRDDRRAERPRPGAAPAPAYGGGPLRAGLLGRGPRRHRASAGVGAGERRPRQRRVVLRQPCRVLLLPRAVGAGPDLRPGAQACLQRGLPGREQPVRRQPPPLRPAHGGADPRPRPHRLPAHDRREPGGLPRVAHLGAPDEGAAARDHGARGAGGRGRPSTFRDRTTLRAPAGTSRRRRLAAAVPAPGGLRGRPRGR